MYIFVILCIYKERSILGANRYPSAVFFFGSIIHTSKGTNTLVELERAPNRHTPLSLTIKSPATRLTAKANNKIQKKIEKCRENQKEKAITSILQDALKSKKLSQL